ncbi:MAG TPA: AarF/ABC1/UbiB kinase family protein [Nevskiaceae bacterium]|nr:AarF/ABC1/UbiB kinase family protein [Nevskiaceae bacterium]
MSIRKITTSGRAARLFGAGARTFGRNLLRHVPGGDRIERQARYWAEVGEDWANTLGELRGAAMKVGQMMAQYSDLFPAEFTDKLKRLQRNVEPLPYDAMAPLLDQAWDAAQRARVVHIDEQALAAASIGQVHRAVLDDGRHVVIKLRYPGVNEAVDADVNQLRRLLGISRVLPVDNASMDALVGELRARFQEETDFANELRNLLDLRRLPHPGIVYPEPVESLCGPGVLVLSEEAGASLEQARRWPQPLRDQLGSNVLAWLCRGIYRQDTVHADPHPGNFAFREDGSVVVYDFGCVKRVQPGVRDELRRLLACGLSEDWAGTHATMERLGGIARGVSADQLSAFYAELAERIYVPVRMQPYFDFEDESYVPAIRACVRSHLGHSFKFRPVAELLFVTRAVSGVYWLLRGLGARVAVRQVLEANGAFAEAPAPELPA